MKDPGGLRRPAVFKVVFAVRGRVGLAAKGQKKKQRGRKILVISINAAMSAAAC